MAEIHTSVLQFLTHPIVQASTKNINIYYPYVKKMEYLKMTQLKGLNKAVN